MNGDVLQRVERELGVSFLSYLLNANDDVVRQRLAGTQPLMTEQEAALTEIENLVDRLIAMHLLGDESEPGPSFVAKTLLSYDHAHETTVANALRLRAGGALVDVGERRVTADWYLAALARDCYAATLLPPVFPDIPIRGGLDYIAYVVWRHPLKDLFEKSVLGDAELAPLFTTHDEASGHSGAYYTNLGHGGGIQLWMLAEGLMSAAHWSLALDGHVDSDAVTNATVENLSRLRRLVAGDAVEVKARLGVAGIPMGEVNMVSTPWGTLRALTTEESTRVSELEGVRSEAVLETPVDMKLYLGSGIPAQGTEGPGELGRVSQRLHDDLGDRFNRFALTLFLALERQRPVAVSRSWTMFDDIVRLGGGMSWSPTPWLAASEALRAEELEAIEEWAGRVQRHYHRSITVASQRVVTALAQRYDPADGLIDAVIALENLFGTSSETQGEITFRVSTACAYLLEPLDVERRRALRREVATIYRERSKIVHGGPPSADAWKHRERAAEIVQQSLRRLFIDKPELLRNADRGIELILGS